MNKLKMDELQIEMEKLRLVSEIEDDIDDWI